MPTDRDMFTGIIEELGIVKNNSSNKITVEANLFSETRLGESISVSGVCLTVVERNGNSAAFEASDETKRRTTLSRLRAASKVNLERAVKVGERLGGHIVTGHVDCIGKIIKGQGTGDRGQGKNIEIEVPVEIMKYVVEKGSVAVDGVSLTVTEVKARSFVLSILPYTLNATTLAQRSSGDSVNIEVDILGKYIEKLLAKEKKDITKDFLISHGFGA